MAMHKHMYEILIIYIGILHEFFLEFLNIYLVIKITKYFYIYITNGPKHIIKTHRRCKLD
jgi:hypothetical protein